jgi:SAM-dependent methyltransferase
MLARIKRKIRNWEMIRLSKLAKELDNLPDFPSSSSSNKQFVDLTILGARQNYEQLVKLSQTRPQKPKTLDQYLDAKQNLELTKKLSDLFQTYGSDKAGTHDYYKIYSEILGSRMSKRVDILEIGIGSNNVDVPSNMGKNGKPGASLRSFRDLSENVHVIGADVDARILFTEERIGTFHLDQLNDDSWVNFRMHLKDTKFDLIIDDGLHAPISNLKTIQYLESQLKPDGIIIVEDIHERSLPVWQLLEIVTKGSLHIELICTKAAHMALITKK